jgi:hypothetical protein
MRRTRITYLLVLGGFLHLSSVRPVLGQGTAGPAAGRGPLEPYLMVPADEIELARSAAPVEATVLVLTPRGYEVAVPGTNGFACLVDRSWGAFFGIPAAAFWNSRQRGPTCLNPQAVRTVLPVLLKRAELAVAGYSQEQMMQEIETGFGRAELRQPEVGAMAYMMSKRQYLDDRDPTFRPHVMFYTPSSVSGLDWGANQPGSPVMVGLQRLPNGKPEPQILFLVPVGQWSDGTVAEPGTPDHQH